jgi:hypothetical protein
MYLPKEEIVYGIDTYMEPEDNNQLNNLLKIPFKNESSPKNS